MAWQPSDRRQAVQPIGMRMAAGMRFWDASGVCLRLLYKLSTVRVFLTDADPSEASCPGRVAAPPRKSEAQSLGTREGGAGQAQSEGPWSLLSLGRCDLHGPIVTILGWASRIFLCKYSGYLAVAQQGR